MDVTYNGYKNYETWYIKLHLFDDESNWYEYDIDALKEHAAESLDTDNLISAYIIDDFLKKVDWFEILEMIERHFSDYCCHNCGEPTDYQENYCCKDCEEENLSTMLHEKG